MSKQDTKFGEIIRAEAKRIYGEDFEFDKCTIDVNYGWKDGEDDSPISYIVTFEIVREELGVSIKSA